MRKKQGGRESGGDEKLYASCVITVGAVGPAGSAFLFKDEETGPGEEGVPASGRLAS